MWLRVEPEFDAQISRDNVFASADTAEPNSPPVGLDVAFEEIEVGSETPLPNIGSDDDFMLDKREMWISLGVEVLSVPAVPAASPEEKVELMKGKGQWLLCTNA